MKPRWTFLEYAVGAQTLIVILLVGYFFWSRSPTGLMVELRTGDPGSRAMAATKLGEQGPRAREAIPLLQEMLRYPNDLVQIRSAAALGEIGGAQALADTAKSPDTQVRLRAIMALRGMYNLDTDARAQRIQVFIAALKDSNPAARQGAAGALGEASKEAAESIPDLKEALHDEESRVRIAAAQSLGTIGSLEDFTEMFAASDLGIRREAVYRVGRFGSNAVPALTGALQDQSPEIVGEAADALRQIGTPAQTATSALERACTNPDAGARMRVIEALEVVGGTEAIPALRDAVNDQDPSVREWARSALSRLERKASQQ